MCSKRPTPLEAGNVLLGPYPKAVTLWAPRIINAGRRIGLNDPRPYRPTEQPAHRIEKVSRLGGRIDATVAPALDASRRYFRGRCVARPFRDLAEDVFSLPSRCR